MRPIKTLTAAKCLEMEAAGTMGETMSLWESEGIEYVAFAPPSATDPAPDATEAETMDLWRAEGAGVVIVAIAGARKLAGDPVLSNTFTNKLRNLP